MSAPTVEGSRLNITIFIMSLFVIRTKSIDRVDPLIAPNKYADHYVQGLFQSCPSLECGVRETLPYRRPALDLLLPLAGIDTRQKGPTAFCSLPKDTGKSRVPHQNLPSSKVAPTGLEPSPVLKLLSYRAPTRYCFLPQPLPLSVLVIIVKSGSGWTTTQQYVTCVLAGETLHTNDTTPNKYFGWRGCSYKLFAS